MILLINTTNPQKSTIILANGNHFFAHTFSSEFHQAEKLLKEINSFFKKRKVSLKSLKGIVVVLGPGPFTALRIGIIVTNTLGYTLNLKTAGLKQNEFSSLEELVKKGRAKLKKVKGFKILQPYYGQKPNITKPKKRS